MRGPTDRLGLEENRTGDMDLGVRDKGHLIVGGTQGMGLATARVLAEEGGKVAVSARNPLAKVPAPPRPLGPARP